MPQMDKTQQCEWHGCHQRYQHYVALEDPRHPESIYVCAEHREAAILWYSKTRALRGYTEGRPVTYIDLLNW